MPMMYSDSTCMYMYMYVHTGRMCVCRDLFVQDLGAHDVLVSVCVCVCM